MKSTTSDRLRPAGADIPRIRLAAVGLVLVRPDGGQLVGPCDVQQRPPAGVGETLQLPGLCRILGWPVRPVRVLTAGDTTWWWWGVEEAPAALAPARAGQARFEVG